MIAWRQGLARAGHPHGQGEEAEDDRRVFVVVIHQGPIAADAGVVVDVARLGLADDRVDQESPAPICSAARLVSSSWARCRGLRVWKATTFSQPRVAKWSRSSKGVRRISTKS